MWNQAGAVQELKVAVKTDNLVDGVDVQRTPIFELDMDVQGARELTLPPRERHFVPHDVKRSGGHGEQDKDVFDMIFVV